MEQLCIVALDVFTEGKVSVAEKSLRTIVLNGIIREKNAPIKLWKN